MRKLGIAISFYIEWNKKGCGHIDDSMSGHAVIIGTRTKMVIGIICYSMHYCKCKAARKLNATVQKHNCPWNHNGSSKGLESTATLEVLMHIDSVWKCKVFFEKAVSDNDSTMRARLSHSTTNTKVKLPTHIPEPIFFVTHLIV